MKKILIWLLLTVSVFLWNTYAWGHPTSSSNVLVENIDEISWEPDYNFEVNSQEDFYEMLKILYKYYNIYNLKNYNNENTGEVVWKIEEIEGILNPLVEIYIPTHWTVSEFTLWKRNQEANTDLLKSLWHDVGHIGILQTDFELLFGKNENLYMQQTFILLQRMLKILMGKVIEILS